MDNYFSLLQCPQRFAIDLQALEDAWRRACANTHPDRFATATEAEKRVALQWAARVNQAYQVLKDPISRASYLCELAGVSIDADNNTAMDPAFLMEQLQWREAVDEAAATPDPQQALTPLLQQVQAKAKAQQQQLCQALDQAGDYEQARRLVRQAMFLAKLQNDIQQRLI